MIGIGTGTGAVIGAVTGTGIALCHGIACGDVIVIVIVRVIGLLVVVLVVAIDRDPIGQSRVRSPGCGLAPGPVLLWRSEPDLRQEGGVGVVVVAAAVRMGLDMGVGVVEDMMLDSLEGIGLCRLHTTRGLFQDGVVVVRTCLEVDSETIETIATIATIATIETIETIATIACLMVVLVLVFLKVSILGDFRMMATATMAGEALDV